MNALFHAIITLILLLSFGIQEFIPSNALLKNATLYLPPLLFFCYAASTPFAAMLCYAFITGFLWDFFHMTPHTALPMEQAAILLFENNIYKDLLSPKALPIGFSILWFASIGTLLQGVRPLFMRGRIEIPVLMIGLSQLSWLTLEYGIITFMRGTPHFPTGLWIKLISSSLFSTLAAPVVFLILYQFADLSNRQHSH
jgi:hypothetical protein